jgi:hypothetical protein
MRALDLFTEKFVHSRENQSIHYISRVFIAKCICTRVDAQTKARRTTSIVSKILLLLTQILFGAASICSFVVGMLSRNKGGKSVKAHLTDLPRLFLRNIPTCSSEKGKNPTPPNILTFRDL